MKFIFKIDFSNPLTIFNGSIIEMKKAKNKSVSLMEYSDDYSNMEDLKSISDYINDPDPKVITNPIIYLYNTHQLENYNSDDLDIYGITPTVQMASYLLRENLLSQGVDTIVEGSNISDILNSNSWDYSYSYQASRSLIISAKNKYKSLKYFIDIHRDSISKDLSTININNKSYAKILFVIGKDYSTWQNNYNLANALNKKINNDYNGISRGILTKTGIKVNGVYNQDIDPNILLIEVGGVDNTISEVYNTILILAEEISKYVKETS